MVIKQRSYRCACWKAALADLRVLPVGLSPSVVGEARVQAGTSRGAGAYRVEDTAGMS